MSRSLAPAQIVPDALLGSVRLVLPPSGVLLGRDTAGSPVHLRLFGHEPMSLAFVGGWWAAQLLVHRVLAYGASVLVDAVDTTAPGRHGALAGLSQWLALDRTAGRSGTRVSAAAWRPTGPGTASEPMLFVHDVGPAGPTHEPAPLAWQTRLLVLSRITPASQPHIASADMVLSQRLDSREAAVVSTALMLPDEFADRMGTMTDEMLAVCRPRRVGYLWLTPTTVERQHFG